MTCLDCPWGQGDPGERIIRLGCSGGAFGVTRCSPDNDVPAESSRSGFVGLGVVGIGASGPNLIAKGVVSVLSTLTKRGF